MTSSMSNSKFFNWTFKLGIVNEWARVSICPEIFFQWNRCFISFLKLRIPAEKHWCSSCDAVNHHTLFECHLNFLVIAPAPDFPKKFLNLKFYWTWRSRFPANFFLHIFYFILSHFNKNIMKGFRLWIDIDRKKSMGLVPVKLIWSHVSIQIFLKLIKSV